MQARLVCIILLLTVCLCGCETAKGIQKDANNTWSGLTSQNGWVQKADHWMKENMW